jgi:hypothetical protein
MTPPAQQQVNPNLDLELTEVKDPVEEVLKM